MKNSFSPIQIVPEDGFPIMEVGNWAQKKYKLVGKYCDIFTRAMHNKWNLIYLDLFSGPGYVRNRDSSHIFKNSALIAASLENNFDHYLLNDFSKDNSDALERRFQKHAPDLSFTVFNQDANENIEKVLSQIPDFRNGKGDLIFCFLDPFSLNLNFDTVKILSRYQTDFLILHALQMDAKRNLIPYYKEGNERVARFTGNPYWRDDFTQNGYTDRDFARFLADQYDQSMRRLGYSPADNKERIENSIGMGIYYLAFYSKHPLGLEFFKKISKGNSDQLELF